MPLPNWEKVWCRPSGRTTLWAACPPPLKRTLSRAPVRAVRASTSEPLPASP